MEMFKYLILWFLEYQMVNSAKVVIKTPGSSLFSGNYGTTNQSLLLADLFKNYYQGAIPSCDDVKGPIDVKVGMAIRQIIELNEREQLLNMNVWIRLQWTDCLLRWNPENYGGIESLTLPYGKIWTPDITLYDNKQENDGGLPGLSAYRPSVKADGEVSYNFPTVLYSMCRVDPKYFPFDVQTCTLKFGSWSYHGLDLNVLNMTQSADTSAFRRNVEWDLLSATCERHSLKYSCCIEPYPDVTFTIRMRRKPMSYIVNIIFPCVLITTLALLGFILPADSGEKIGLEITVLLGLAVYAQVVSESLPVSDDVPYVGIYFACAMLMVFMSLTFTIIVLNVHFRGMLGVQVPRILKKIVLQWLARLVLLYNVTDADPDVQTLFKKKFGNGSEIGIDNIGFDSDKSKEQTETKSITLVPSIESPTHEMIGLMKDQLKILNIVHAQFQEKQAEDEMNSEWQRVALVMDRLFLIIFTICTSIVTASTLLLIMV